jgi:hypothetical protein
MTSSGLQPVCHPGSCVGGQFLSCFWMSLCSLSSRLEEIVLKDVGGDWFHYACQRALNPGAS